MQDSTKNPWTRLSSKVVYENAWIRVSHDEVSRPDGKPGIYGTVHFKNQAVGVVAVDDNDRTLMVGQYRYPLETYSWEIPEGGAPEGEDPLEAGKRELKEETGYLANEWKPLVRAHLSNSVTDEVSFCFLATGLTKGQSSPEGTEQLQVKWVPASEVRGMMAAGEITDALSLLGLQAYFLDKAATQ